MTITGIKRGRKYIIFLALLVIPATEHLFRIILIIKHSGDYPQVEENMRRYGISSIKWPYHKVQMLIETGTIVFFLALILVVKRSEDVPGYGKKLLLFFIGGQLLMLAGYFHPMYEYVFN